MVIRIDFIARGAIYDGGTNKCTFVVDWWINVGGVKTQQEPLILHEDEYYVDFIQNIIKEYKRLYPENSIVYTVNGLQPVS
jgi:hypothetical protein